MAGLSVGGFIGIVIVILILNVAGVIGYYKFTEKNPDKAVSVNLDSGLVPKIRYVCCDCKWLMIVAYGKKAMLIDSSCKSTCLTII